MAAVTVTTNLVVQSEAHLFPHRSGVRRSRDSFAGVKARCEQGWLLLGLLGRLCSLPRPASRSICIPRLLAASLRPLLSSPRGLLP